MVMRVSAMQEFGNAAVPLSRFAGEGWGEEIRFDVRKIQSS
jgi:hypothetical protein